MPSIEDHLFNLKFASKGLVRESKKAEKESKRSKQKCKKAMEKGNMDVAKVYAENAIRQKNESVNFLKLSSRMDTVASRVQTAAKMNTLSKNMKGIVSSMDNVLGSMDIEKITTVMDKFEKQFEELDIRSEYMENSINSTAAMTTPQDEVSSLMQQVADEHHIEFQSDMDAVKVRKDESKKEAVEDDDLASRLKSLQGL